MGEPSTPLTGPRFTGHRAASTPDLRKVLQEVVARIRATLRPERIVLFGSRARGTAQAGSDFDLLVIRESDEPRYRRAAPLYSALADLPVEVDLLVYTPEEVRQWSGVPGAFVTTALREGKVLYEREGRPGPGLAPQG